jgi:hypothetical protein
MGEVHLRLLQRVHEHETLKREVGLDEGDRGGEDSGVGDKEGGIGANQQ